MKGIEIEAFVVSQAKEGQQELFGRPIYERMYILKSAEKKNIIMGVSKPQYANEICKWFIDNGIEDVIFYQLSK